VSVERVLWTVKRTNVDIILEVRGRQLPKTLITRKPCYFKHVMRKPEENLGENCNTRTTDGTRCRGWPYRAWINNITDWTELALQCVKFEIIASWQSRPSCSQSSRQRIRHWRLVFYEIYLMQITTTIFISPKGTRRAKAHVSWQPYRATKEKTTNREEKTTLQTFR